MKTITSMIKLIHDSDIKGTFVEIGAGMPVSNALLAVEGASKTLVKAYCPYDKDLQTEDYEWAGGTGTNLRSVSYEMIKAICNIEYSRLTDDDKGNFVYASSFQLGEDICNHGWIGVWFKGDYYFYHLTLSANLTRQENIDYLGETGVEIMYALTNKDVYVPAEADIVLDEDGNINRELMFPESGDYYSVFNLNGKIERLEDTFRGSEGIIIYKGSFNPLHEGHIEIMDRTKKLFPGYRSALMLSVDTHGKGTIDKYDVFKRIKALNEAGYYVIVTEFPFFTLNAVDITERLKCEVVFPMGIDTYERLEDHEIDMFPALGAVGVVFSRSHRMVNIERSSFICINDNKNQDISSTKLRNNDFTGL